MAGLFALGALDVERQSAYMCPMNILLRSSAALLLMAVLVLTSVSMAVARTAPDAAGQMVLCIGEGSVVVRIDEDGQPIGPAHYCPECAFSSLDGLTPTGSDIALAGIGAQVRFEVGSVLDIAQKIHAAQARGPPAQAFV